MRPTNLGQVTRLQPAHRVVRSQELEDEARRKRSEVSLDPMLDEQADWSADDEGSMRMIGYAALVVTFLVFIVLLSPWLGPVVRGWFA